MFSTVQICYTNIQYKCVMYTLTASYVKTVPFLLSSYQAKVLLVLESLAGEVVSTTSSGSVVQLAHLVPGFGDETATHQVVWLQL